jgi:hypothetical protein
MQMVSGAEGKRSIPNTQEMGTKWIKMVSFFPGVFIPSRLSWGI